MQISKVPEVVGGGEGSAGRGGGGGGNSEYQTANELFELMTKNTHFDNTDYSLSAQDLVLLYQNIDIGTKLMNDASEATVKKPNQYVETVVYNDDDGSNSDCSEIFTPNDINDVFTINQERLDFLNDKSLENLVCPKSGGYEMHTSNLSFDYDKSFLFHDPYIKNQLQNFNLTSESSEYEKLFSTSLVDYICCKRIEDKYNFYMDNIITYVQHSIDQLKRISNGDYLTDRAKEKWMEVTSTDLEQEDDTKVLATSTSIPLRVDCKNNGNVTWDDIVHSEVDVRSLSKMLEKKIIVEIPKLICGSFRLVSKRCADNLIISCQRERHEVEKEGQESRLGVVLQLQRSQTGHVMSNISSIMVLKTTPALPDIHAKELLPLEYKEASDEPIQNIEKQENEKEPAITVFQLIRDPEDSAGVRNTIIEEIPEVGNDYQDSYLGTNDYPISDRIASYTSIQYSSESSVAVGDIFDRHASPLDKVAKKPFNLISPDELHMTMQKLNMQNSALNEASEDTMSQSTSKKRSPVRIRIKSPYENKSFLVEDKKRKRLLEIRARREKKKLAMSECSKVNKHKFEKGVMMPQASNSVTKLSITNKSFYNSIYGQNNGTENKPKSRKLLKNTPDVSLTIDETQEDFFESPALTPDKNNKKYINRSYYLDDAETEMMYMQMKKNESKDSCSASDSMISNEFNASLEILQELITPSETNFTDDPICLTGSKRQSFSDNTSYSGGNQLFPIEECMIPMNTTTSIHRANKKSSSEECRKSIDELYDLINKCGKSNAPPDLEETKNKLATNYDLNEAQTIQGSESGASVKHIIATNGTSPGRSNMVNSNHKCNKTQSVRTPKVIISSKAQSPKTEPDKIKKDRNEKPDKSRAVFGPLFKGPLPDNPLKAISQLLHEFDDVQKNRQKPSTEAKPPKKVENVANDVKTYSRQGSYRRKSRLDQHLKDHDQEPRKGPPISTNLKDKRVKPMSPMELARTPIKQSPVEDRTLERNPQKKITDIIDEAKEARGEAVRGPTKNNSRLASLAQPKKSYVQAHHEEYQTRYGKNVMADRLQKLATTPTPVATIERNMMSPVIANRNRWRKSGSETATASVKQRAPSVPHLDQKAVMMRKRRSASSSPETVTRLVPVGHKHPPTEASNATSKLLPESHVQNQYAPAARGEPRRELAAGLRCRVPILPRDIELMPQEEASSLDNMAPHTAHSPGSSAAGVLTMLAESTESRIHMDPPRSESDYCVDILEDRHLTTAVSTLHADSVSSYEQNYNSTAEIEQLETALYSHISGSFQKRLRIKNLTLTPKPSRQQVFLLQSGDAGSVLVNSFSSHKLKKTIEDSLHELKTLPVLSNSHLEWGFAHFPVQITTVGYAFPERLQNCSSKSNLIGMNLATTSDNTVERPCQASQCSRGCPPKPVADSSAQVDVVTGVAAELFTFSVENVGNRAASTQIHATEPIEAAETNQYSSLVTTDEVESTKENANKPTKETDSVKTEEIKVYNEKQEPKPSLKPPLPAPSLETVSYTTSLDMLVGLLTEIQKITCQNQINNHENCSDTDISRDITAFKKLENTTCDLVSISSLENLRQLESNTSIYTYNLSNLEGSVHTNLESVHGVEPVLELTRNSNFTENSVDIQPVASFTIKEHVAVGASKPTLVDKEVGTNLWEAEVLADVCTSVPSAVSCIPMNCSVNTSVSGLPLSYSTLTIYHTPRSSATRIPLSNKIIELPQIETRASRALIRDKTDLNEKCITLSICNVDVKKENRFRSELTRCVKSIDLDPMFNIKRDILVSMYSILVLTVFAALSFPELLMFQS